MGVNNPNAKKLRENDRKNAKPGPRSKIADPKGFKNGKSTSKIRHSKKSK